MSAGPKNLQLSKKHRGGWPTQVSPSSAGPALCPNARRGPFFISSKVSPEITSQVIPKLRYFEIYFTKNKYSYDIIHSTTITKDSSAISQAFNRRLYSHPRCNISAFLTHDVSVSLQVPRVVFRDLQQRLKHISGHFPQGVCIFILPIKQTLISSLFLLAGVRGSDSITHR